MSNQLQLKKAKLISVIVELWGVEIEFRKATIHSQYRIQEISR